MATHSGHDLVLVLDFGGQYTQLIARRIREQGVYCEIRPCNDPPERPPRLKGIVFSGGPSSVYDKGAPPFDPRWFDIDVPFLGICYGLQLMAHHLGGKVEPSDHREYGHAQIEILDPGAQIFRGIETGKHDVWMSHGDLVQAPPRGFRTIASSPSCPVAAVADVAGRRFGIQFHAEVTHTAIGERIFRSFLFDVCDCHPDWTMGSFLEEQKAAVRDKVGDEHVLCALSGGVDSAVVAALLHQALGPRLHCVFVDNGVLRKGERQAVESEFKDLGVRVVDARERFLQALAGVSDPERKRKIIGETFIRVFEDEAKALERETGPIRFLAQGTLYPDVIESVSFRGPSATIKSHHNVGGLPERMDMKLIEPLRELFKDEVRRLGRELGLSESRVQRQPFPGPGLAVRILGPVDADAVHLLGEADAIVDTEIRAAGLYQSLWQSFAVLLPVKSVGVMGDDRTYERACVIRAVQSLDGMTANVAELPWSVLHRISSRIINEVRGINRVCYDISSKPPATIEWE
jgi:GMP synthase (glutamine-hydrolysing)